VLQSGPNRKLTRYPTYGGKASVFSPLFRMFHEKTLWTWLGWITYGGLAIRPDLEVFLRSCYRPLKGFNAFYDYCGNNYINDIIELYFAVN